MDNFTTAEMQKGWSKLDLPIVRGIHLIKLFEGTKDF